MLARSAAIRSTTFPPLMRRGVGQIGGAFYVWTMEEIIGMMGIVEPKPGRPRTYKKRLAA